MHVPDSHTHLAGRGDTGTGLRDSPHAEDGDSQRCKRLSRYGTCPGSLVGAGQWVHSPLLTTKHTSTCAKTLKHRLRPRAAAPAEASVAEAAGVGGPAGGAEAGLLGSGSRAWVPVTPLGISHEWPAVPQVLRSVTGTLISLACFPPVPGDAAEMAQDTGFQMTSERLGESRSLSPAHPPSPAVEPAGEGTRALPLSCRQLLCVCLCVHVHACMCMHMCRQCMQCLHMCTHMHTTSA